MGKRPGGIGARQGSLTVPLGERSSALAIHGMQPAGKVGQASAQCHLLCQVRPSASPGGADALGGALWARRPPGRLLDDRRCLILRGKSGTRASRADQGVRPTINTESHLSGKVSDIGLQPSPKGTPGFSPTFFGFVSVRHHAAKPENLGRPRRSRLKPACRLNACPTKRPNSSNATLRALTVAAL